MKEIYLPKGAKKIIERLKYFGYESYVVGGCLRDVIMGSTPKDWDICTDAKPEEILHALSVWKVIPTGLKHGTITVIPEDIPYEVTTFRQDDEYRDYRRPERVTFVSDITMDLGRRDFTINAMAYNHEKGLIDPYGGLTDIERGVIRCVGNPGERFEEDALRILRALRFASRLGFDIEKSTAGALVGKRELLRYISFERIRAEFDGILLGEFAGNILRRYREVFAVVMPEIKSMFDVDQENEFHIYDVWEHTLNVVENLPENIYLRLAGFFHDIGKFKCKFVEEGTGHFYGHEKEGAGIAEEVMKRLKYDNFTIKLVTELIEAHGIIFVPETRQPGRLLNKMGEEKLKLLIELEKADVKSQNPKYSEARLQNIRDFGKKIDEILESEACFSLKHMAIKGKELKEIGIPEGKMIGEILQILLDKILEGELENDREMLLAEAKKEYFCRRCNDGD